MTDTSPTPITAPTTNPVTESGDAGAIVAQASAHSRALVEQAVDTNAEAVAVLLGFHGFAREKTQAVPRLLTHPATGVTVASHPHGYRICFHVPDSPTGMALIDLPSDTVYSVVEYIAVAVNAKVAQDMRRTTSTDSAD